MNSDILIDILYTYSSVATYLYIIYSGVLRGKGGGSRRTELPLRTKRNIL